MDEETELATLPPESNNLSVVFRLVTLNLFLFLTAVTPVV